MDSADRGGFGSDSKIESASAVDREEEQRARDTHFAFRVPISPIMESTAESTARFPRVRGHFASSINSGRHRVAATATYPHGSSPPQPCTCATLIPVLATDRYHLAVAAATARPARCRAAIPLLPKCRDYARDRNRGTRHRRVHVYCVRVGPSAAPTEFQTGSGSLSRCMSVYRGFWPSPLGSRQPETDGETMGYRRERVRSLIKRSLTLVRFATQLD